MGHVFDISWLSDSLHLVSFFVLRVNSIFCFILFRSNYFIAKRAAKTEISGDQENPAFEGQTEKASENKSEHKNGENPSYEGEKTEESKATVIVEKPEVVKKERLKSLDTFRG